MAFPGFSRRPKAIVPVLGVCFVAVLLLALSMPRFIATVTQVPGNATLRALQDRRPVTVGALEQLVKSRAAASSWIDSGRVRGDLALARLLLWEESQKSGRATKRQLHLAITDLTDSLTRAPANPYAWARLAGAWTRVDGSDGKAARALAMSFLTGPREPELIAIRSRLTFDLWLSILPQDRHLALSHVRFGFLVNPNLVASLAGDSAARGIVMTALEGVPRQSEKFESLIRRKPR